MRYAPTEDAHRPYRAPEMAGPMEVRPTQQRNVRKSGTVAAILLAIALLACAAFLIAGFYGPLVMTEMSSLVGAEPSH